jgi:hypothetical protein
VNASFNGQTFAILGDGAYLGTAVVAGGLVALPKPCNYAIVGLRYESQVQMLPLSDLTMTKTMGRIHVRFLKTLDARAQQGTAFDGSVLVGTSQSFSLGGVDVTQPIPALYSDDERLPIETTWDTKALLNILSGKPLPCTVTAIVAEVEVTE